MKKLKRINLWIKAFWLFLWYKPIYKNIEKREEYDDGEIEVYNEERWYVNKRKVSWYLLFPFLFVFIFIYGGFKSLIIYILWVETNEERWITGLKKDINFRDRLSVVLSLAN